nr:NAD(P)-binding domain-containing protein [Nocardiopsis mwathae]
MIGLGPMGQAMGRALLKAGHPLTVWNRTREKAAPLVEQGAVLADTPADAVAANELVLLSLTDYDVMYRLLGDLDAELRGRTLVNLSSDTPARARAGASWARERGAAYVTGGVMTPPPGIGDPSMSTFYSGDKEAFEAVRPVLETLTAADFRGTDPGLAQVYYQVVMNLFWTSMTSFVHSVALARAEGIAVGTIVPYLVESNDMADFYRGLGEEITAGEFPGELERLSMDAASADHVLHTARDAGVDDTLPAAVMSILQRGLDAGYHDRSFSILATLMDAGDRA